MRASELFESKQKKLNGLTVMSLDQFVDHEQQDVEESAGDSQWLDRADVLIKKLGRLGQAVVTNPMHWRRYESAVENNDTDWLYNFIAYHLKSNTKEMLKLDNLIGDIGGGLGRLTDFAWSVKEGKWKEDFLEPWEEYKSSMTSESLSEAPFGLGSKYRAMSDDEMQDFLGRVKTKSKTKRDKFDYPYVHGSNVEIKDEKGREYDLDALKAMITARPKSILGQNAKMQHSETGSQAIYDIGLPALKGLAVNEETGEFVVVDTCPGAGACKTYCYAMQGGYVMFKAASMSSTRLLNFLLNDPEGFASMLNTEIEKSKAKLGKKNVKMVVRWHDAGDFFSPEYLDVAYQIANDNPDVEFYAYTKIADVATASRPKNFRMNFSGGAHTSQEKKVDFQRVKHSKVVPQEMFWDLIARDGNKLIKDAKDRMQFKSSAELEEFKQRMAKKYALDTSSIITYDEMMRTPEGDKNKWNVIVMPGDGDNAANRDDVLGSYLLFH